MNPSPRPPSKKRHLTITLILVAVFAITIGFSFKGLFVNTTQIPSAQLEKPAKDFKVAWVQGREHLAQSNPEALTLADLKGRPVILNFWASWCVSCRQEALDLEKFWKTRANKDILVVGIAIQDTVEAAQAFAQHYGKTYMLALDVDGRAAIDYGVTGVPETFVINREGVIVHKEAGPVTTEMLAELAKKL